MPIDGLSFDAGNITFNNIPFEQCSSSEQLRVSVAMGLAMNPELRLLLIHDGSLLDSDNLQMISDMAQAADTTILIECVGEGQECSIIIEDGSVKEVR
jgi:ABC-type histidine transport system ATPase subunit